MLFVLEPVSIAVNERAAESIKEIDQCISTLKQKITLKNPHLLFIYPAMKARSFHELSQQCKSILEKNTNCLQKLFSQSILQLCVLAKKFHL